MRIVDEAGWARTLSDSLSLGERIKSAAQAGDWDEVLRSAGTRQQQLESLMGRAAADEAHRPFIDRVLLQNRELDELLEQERERMALALRQLHAGKQARHSYLSSGIPD